MSFLGLLIPQLQEAKPLGLTPSQVRLFEG